MAPILVPILAALLLSGPAARSSAPAPGTQPPANAKEGFARADAVFTGRVESVKTDRYGFASLAAVRVQTIWKGGDRINPVTLVDGQGGPTYPARIFQVGSTYLFYVPVLRRGVVRADAYSQRVLPVQQAQADLKQLAAGRRE